MQINENDIAKLVQSVLSEMTSGNAETPKVEAKPEPKYVPQGDGKKIPTYASFLAGEPKKAGPKCASSCGVPDKAKVAVLTAKEKLERAIKEYVEINSK